MSRKQEEEQKQLKVRRSGPSVEQPSPPMVVLVTEVEVRRMEPAQVCSAGTYVFALI